MFYLFYCLTVHPAFTVNWLLHHVPLMITRVECSILRALELNKLETLDSFGRKTKVDGKINQVNLFPQKIYILSLHSESPISTIIFIMDCRRASC